MTRNDWNRFIDNVMRPNLFFEWLLSNQAKPQNFDPKTQCDGCWNDFKDCACVPVDRNWKTHELYANSAVAATCLVHHGDGYGACGRCIHCHQMIRPQNMNDKCSEGKCEDV